MNTQFVTLLAWVFGIGATILVIGRVYWAATYSELDRRLDLMQGVRVTWPIMKPLVVAIVCWAWILTN